MLLMPDASTAILDPFTEAPTLSLICEIADPLTREGYAKDPRRVARRAEDVPALDRHRRHRVHRARVRVLRLRRGLVRARPEHGALRGRLGRGPLELRQARARLHDPREGGLLPAGAARHAARPAHADGADARAARHPVRVPPPRGRVRRPVRDRPPLPDADAHGRSGHDLQVRRQERRARSRQDGDVHAEADLRRQRLGHAHAPVALEGGHAADGGQVAATPACRSSRGRTSAACSTHAPALLAFCAPTTNSYRRLVPGFEAPVNLVYSQRNRSACIRIPMYSDSPKAKRIEFRCPDASANPYLAFSAMLMAGLDGIQKGLDAGEPADYDLFEEAHGGVPQVPGSLDEALDALERDHEFLTEGRRVQRGPDPHLDRLQAGERGRRRAAAPASPPSSPSTTTASDGATILRSATCGPTTGRRSRRSTGTGCADGLATFETEVPSVGGVGRRALATRVVAEVDGEVVGLAAAVGRVSSRRCYRGVAENERLRRA